ncbi:MAG: hypothetical protein JO302_04605 [Candidatus Eremiobacteraeota bacterium]|nr:hypothetical protein [Candidatus Eremiobacteraeota bacterium]
MDAAVAMRRGMIAGAAGATALDALSYMDMLVRGRSASDVPGQTVSRLVKSIGLILDGEDTVSSNRRTASGALLGHADGVLAASLYALIRSAIRVPWPVGAAFLAGITLVTGEGSAVRTGATDWSKWSLSEWVTDIVPRLAFGIVAAVVVEALER